MCCARIFGPDVPNGVWNLTQLQTLLLSSNTIAVIPHAIARLQALERFVIDNNQLMELPMSLRLLTRLTEVDIRYELCGPATV